MAKTKTKGTAKTVSDTPVPQPITIRSTNPKIMADNILKLEESIKAADVSANPSGTAEDTLLTTIGIDGKKYDLGPSAENTSYDNTNTGLTAGDVQSAIDEISPALTAEGTSYSSGVSVKDKLDWVFLKNISLDGTQDISAYSEIIIVPCVSGGKPFNSYHWLKAAMGTGFYVCAIEDTTHYYEAHFTLADGVLTNDAVLTAGWGTSNYCMLYGKK